MIFLSDERFAGSLRLRIITLQQSFNPLNKHHYKQFVFRSTKMDMLLKCLCHNTCVIGLLLGLYISELCAAGNPSTFQALYQRYANKDLQVTAHSQHNKAVDTEKCAEYCTKEINFHCQSFSMDHNYTPPLCLLYDVDENFPGVYMASQEGIDHYEGNYKSLFQVLQDHTLYTWINAKRYNVTMEQCARSCVRETKFNCRGFNYQETDRECHLTEATAASSHGVITDDGKHYHQRIGGVLSQFINFGQASLQQLHSGTTYQQVLRGINLDVCASRCLMEENFHCVSFDYVYEGDISQCLLSKYIAANVYGLNENEPRRINHYERIEKDLAYFYGTPYAVLPGSNNKTFKFVTPNRCARYCIHETSFICRSFDYQVTEGKCDLSSSTGSDIGGGLLTNNTEEIHHFEMKPIFDCGGNLTQYADDIASPGWPRNYSHQENCVWNIRVQKNRVIQLNFTHFHLGIPSQQPCQGNEDSLMLTEPSGLAHGAAASPLCVTPGLTSYTSQGNIVTLTFRSNSHGDAPGFRAFYTAEWPCNVHLTQSPGELASPHWPDNYDNSVMCAWRITAPQDAQVKLTISSFELESHVLNHCTEKMDHVQVFDGSDASAKSIKLLCGIQQPSMIGSTGSDLFVVFYSDSLLTQSGFHASFVFEHADGNVIFTDENDQLDRAFADLDPVRKESVPKDDDASTEDEGDNDISASGSSGHSQGVSQYDHNLPQQYKTAMWAVVTLLIILLVAACIGLFLVWRHYRTKVQHLKSLLEEDDPNASESKPLNNPIVVFTNKPNNLMLCNERDQPSSCTYLPQSASPTGACGAAGGYSAEGATGYQKYNNDNMKNINIDNKWQLDTSQDEKDFGENFKLDL